MLIDWFTVAAQLLNFLVLVWLMKRFLYQPVLAAIAAREKHIAAGLADAAARLAAAQTLDAEVGAKSAAFDQQRAALLADAVASAQAQNAALLAQGKAADAAQRSQAAVMLGDQQARLCAAVTRQARDEVLKIVRQALTDLADASLQTAMVNRFIRLLQQLDAPARSKLASAGATAAGPADAQLCSAFPIDAQQRATLTAALTACGLRAETLHFTSAPDLVCGIELRLPGWSLAWNLDQYLHGFAERSSSALTVPA
jgi:F-type H+-transporting ATPase subunit b